MILCFDHYVFYICAGEILLTLLAMVIALWVASASSCIETK